MAATDINLVNRLHYVMDKFSFENHNIKEEKQKGTF